MNDNMGKKTIEQLFDDPNNLEHETCKKCSKPMYASERVYADGKITASSNGWWLRIRAWYDGIKTRYFNTEIQCSCGAEHKLDNDYRATLK